MDLTSATSKSTFPDPDSSPDQDINPDQDIKSYALDAQWRRAVMESISDGLLLLDPTGLVLDMNQAFVDLFGYPLEEGPYHPPYPWWPTEEEDGDTLHDLECFFEEICQGVAPERDFPFLTRDRARIWVHTTGTAIHHGSLGTTHLRIVRDITRQREAQRRRAAAVDVSHGFAVVDDLEDLIGIAEHGFALLFDGECTIRLGGAEGPNWFNAARLGASDTIPPEVQAGLEGSPNPDSVSLRPGILLVPRTPGVSARAWVQFPRPRRISVDEMVAADLLASAFAAALVRLGAQQEASERISNLRTAVESHRLIGQATGILVERHRLLPGAAFERLRRASQRRNVRLREVAAMVVESGEDPDDD